MMVLMYSLDSGEALVRTGVRRTCCDLPNETRQHKPRPDLLKVSDADPTEVADTLSPLNAAAYLSDQERFDLLRSSILWIWSCSEVCYYRDLREGECKRDQIVCEAFRGTSHIARM